MIARVFNSTDGFTTRRFVQTFSRPNSSAFAHGYNSNYLQGIPSEALCPVMRQMSYGMKTSLDNWMQESMFMMRGVFPDLFCRVRNEHVVRHLGERRSTIYIDFEMNSTWIFDADFVSLVKYLYAKRSLEESLLTNGSTVFSVNQLQTPKLLATPFQFTHLVRFVLKVDELKRIESFEIFQDTPPPYMMPLLHQARELSFL